MRMIEAQQQTPTSPTVLVVDDDPGTRFLVNECLDPQGFTIQEAASGEQALSLFPDVKPDLVLLDLNMPGIDGFETCLQIRKRRDGRDVPILVITGRDDSASIDAAYNAGASDFIVKPINWPVLIHHVRYMLRAGRAMNEQHQAVLLQQLIHSLSDLASQFFMSVREILQAATQTIATCDYFANDHAAAAIFLLHGGKLLLSAHSEHGGNISLTPENWRTLTEPTILTGGELAFPLFSVPVNHAACTAPTANSAYTGPVTASIYREPAAKNSMIGVLVIKNENPKCALKTNLGLFAPVTDKLTHLICNAQSQLELYLSAQVFENSIEGFVITDMSMQILRVNNAFEKITGFAAAEVLHKPINVLKSSYQDPAFFKRILRSIRHNGQWKGEIWGRRKDGERVPEWLSISSIKNARGEITHYMGIIVDISLQKEQERQLQQLAHFDHLTGLANRNLFDEQLKHAVIDADATDTSLAVLCIDLDRFKYINESFGHAYGDQLLTIIALRIQTCLDKSGIVARRGGDEFIVMVVNLSPDLSEARQQVKAISQNILTSIRDPLNLDKYELFISASIGITLYYNRDHDPSELVKYADTAMYIAKRKGKNGYQFYTPTISPLHNAERFTLEGAMYKAIENNEFTLYFQPQIELSSGKAVGAEALLRWTNPNLGNVSPMEFIPLAEETGYIKEIGKWVLESICRQLNQWEASGFFENSALKQVAINVSPQQFLQNDFLYSVKSILRQTPLSLTSRLELELTESGLMQNSEDSIQVLTQLRQLGVRISIDDFGTGYSSLSYLKDFPLDALKIDQSFIKGCTDSGSNAAIVRAIIAMASGLGLATIAEGVETYEQLNFIKDNACTMYQGYYKSRPLSLEAFEAFILGAEKKSAGQ